jgi:hypothetical protein
MNLSDGKCTHSVSTENLKQCDLINNVPFVLYRPGADPGFQVRGGALFFGYFVWKNTILRQKIIFFPILGGGAPGAPPSGSAPVDLHIYTLVLIFVHSKLIKRKTQKIYLFPEHFQNPIEKSYKRTNRHP